MLVNSHIIHIFLSEDIIKLPDTSTNTVSDILSRCLPIRSKSSRHLNDLVYTLHHPEVLSELKKEKNPLSSCFIQKIWCCQSLAIDK